MFRFKSANSKTRKFRIYIVTRSFIGSLIEYYSRSLSSILKVLVLFEIKISNSRLNIIQINNSDIKLKFRKYELNLTVILFYNLTHIHILYDRIKRKNLNELIKSIIVFEQLF